MKTMNTTMNPQPNKTTLTSQISVLLSDVPDTDQINLIRQGLERMGKAGLVNENTVFVFAKPDFDVPVGAEFKAIAPWDKSESAMSTRAVLRFVQINRSRHTTCLYQGYSGICLFEFPDGIPELVRNLPVFGQKRKEGSTMVRLLNDAMLAKDS